ncbi:MAG TPA: hypothetical protein VIN33_00225 [Marinobacter sp.]
MKRTAILIAWSLFAWSLVAASTMAAEVRFTGEATGLDDDRAIYDERHVVEGECAAGLFRPGAQTVRYTRDGNREFAEKKLTYDDSVLRPTVEFRQPDFNEVMTITNLDDNELQIEWQPPGGGTENHTVKVTEALVADAGFDHLVRAHWPEVTAGETVEFDFLAPTRGKAYGFVLEPAEDERITAAHTVRIKPSGTILRFLVDPILLGYNEQGLLTDYIGLTNIRKDKDSNYTAHIRYRIETVADCELTR